MTVVIVVEDHLIRQEDTGVFDVELQHFGVSLPCVTVRHEIREKLANQHFMTIEDSGIVTVYLFDRQQDFNVNIVTRLLKKHFEDLCGGREARRLVGGPDADLTAEQRQWIEDHN